MHLLDDFNHLDSNVADSADTELAATLFLKEVFEGLAEHVHHHHVEDFAVIPLLVGHIVQKGQVSLAPQRMHILCFPKQHDFRLIFHSALNLGRIDISCLVFND